jgi:uncharacterized repeat protein (TIGR01451 family)
LSKQKSFLGLMAAAVLCMAVLIMPVTTNADSSGGLTLTATPSVTTASLGETISYNFVITSTCNATISSLVLTDDKLGTISLPATSLAPGENISVSLAYAVAAADFPGPITTTSSVTGITTENETRSASMGTSVALNPLTTSLQVSMSASASSASIGDNITYTYTITNNGQADLSALVLTDSRLGAVTLSSTSLASGATLTATKTYTVLSADLPGPLSSSATATATPSTGAAVTATSAAVSVSLSSENGDIRTKAEILRERGVPGKGIDHAPGLQKPFNIHYKANDNATENGQNHKNNGKGKDK